MISEMSCTSLFVVIAGKSMARAADIEDCYRSTELIMSNQQICNS